MQRSYSTHLLPNTERKDYWRQLIAKTYFPLDIELRSANHFQGNLKQWELDHIGISRLESSSTNFRRGKHQIDSNEEPFYLITLPELETVRFSQAGQSLVCQPGAFILERSDLPYDFSFEQHNAMWVLRIPLSQIRARIRSPERYLYLEFDRQQGVGALFYGMLKSIILQSPYTTSACHQPLSQQLLNLLALSLENDQRVLQSCDAGLRSAHLRNIERYVRANLQRSDLTPEEIANVCNISTRYLHKLFKGSDQTVSQWIRELRLQSALNDIKADTGRTTLAAIAYRWGFNDQAHFCRLFKQRFNCTPREIRTQC